MSIERVTDRARKIRDDQFTVTRARESDPAVSYLVRWQLFSLHRRDGRQFHHREGKPTNMLTKAMRQFEQRKEHAAFAELLRYDDDDVTVVRRFCNLERCRALGHSVEWVLNAANPPYEIAE